jgi:hypothetical protein
MTLGRPIRARGAMIGLPVVEPPTAAPGLGIFCFIAAE